MAERPVFEVKTKGSAFVKYHSIHFGWNLQQSEGDSATDTFMNRAHHKFSNQVLDLSSTSKIELSRKISAQRLTLMKNGEEEKVLNIYNRCRLPVEEQATGDKYKIQQEAFEYEGEFWPSWPRSALYDFLCVEALAQQEDLHDELLDYEYFADLRSVSGTKQIYHAGSVALFVSLKKRDLLDTALTSKQEFLKYCK